MRRNPPDHRSGFHDPLDPDTAPEATAPAVIEFARRLALVGLAALLLAPLLSFLLERPQSPEAPPAQRLAASRVPTAPEARAEPCSSLAPKYRANCEAVVRADPPASAQTNRELAKSAMVPHSLAAWLEPCASLPTSQRPLCEEDARSSYACLAHRTDARVDACMRRAAAEARCKPAAGGLACRPPPSSATCSKVADAWRCP